VQFGAFVPSWQNALATYRIDPDQYHLETMTDGAELLAYGMGGFLELLVFDELADEFPARITFLSIFLRRLHVISLYNVINGYARFVASRYCNVFLDVLLDFWERDNNILNSREFKPGFVVEAIKLFSVS
jgi:hypothetical protein